MPDESHEVRYVSNAETGQAWAAFILGELYEIWPQRCDFHYLEVMTKTHVTSKYDQELVFDHLLLWMRDEGFIRFNQSFEANVMGVSLTQQGMNILGQVSPLADSPSVGSALKKVAGGAASEAGRTAISQIMGLVIGSAAKAYGL
ncbi:hypothetical protein [Cypionkella sp.]|uniref:hypothetical protein n=1 Tax=Cypionkella sp. TaxID=2811411 RepID=UPI0027203AD0|nr:hypothetical protein [Cypionkella sp.]MDO8984260.1 hypothetical protein [Cypionkella sp.]